MQASDWEDIQASLDGDGAAYGRLVERYEKDIARQMLRYSRDPREVRELTQEVFVQAYQSLPGYKPQAPFVHWLRRIASRVGYRLWTYQARERQRTTPLEVWHERLQAVDPKAQSPSEAAEYLFTLLERLKPEDRQILTLFYSEGLEVKEIAERMEWEVSRVKVRMHRARKQLKDMLEAAGYTGGNDG